MLRFQLWKIITIIFVISIGITYALPNFYPPSPAVQITLDSSLGKISSNIARRIYQMAEDTSVNFTSNISNDTDGYDSILIKAENYQDQIKLKEYLEQNLEQEFIIALNLAPNTPSWLSEIQASPMKLGLDLRGGVHFLMEVDSELLIVTRLESYLADIKRKFREERISISRSEISEKKILFSTRTDASNQLDDYLKSNIALFDNAKCNISDWKVTYRKMLKNWRHLNKTSYMKEVLQQLKLGEKNDKSNGNSTS